MILPQAAYNVSGQKPRSRARLPEWDENRKKIPKDGMNGRKLGEGPVWAHIGKRE